MKMTIKIIIIILLVHPCKGQDKMDIFHPIVLKAKETSLYTDQVDWIKVNTKFTELTKGKETVNDLKQGLQYLINSLGDKHAAFRSPKDHAIIVSYTGEIKRTEAYLERDSEFLNTVINDISASFEYQILDDGIGYLKIVGIGPGDVKEQSNIIRNGLKDLSEQGADKWIVDLRYNGGGNIEPMISGLAPLIGEGFVGGAVNNNNDLRTFKIEQGQFYNYNRLVCPMDNLPVLAQDDKVVVLLSRYTASSGEMLAISFKGRKNTRFIGEPTAGYTTGNGYDLVTDDLIMLISQDVFIDRNKTRYENRVGVDEEIEFLPYVSKKEDVQLSSAIKWLHQ